MRSFIVDASVVVQWLNQKGERSVDQAFALLKEATQGNISLLSIDLLLYEVLNAIIRGKGLRGKELEIAVSAFFLLPIEFVQPTQYQFAASVLIAEQTAMTVYDAMYVAIAQEYEMPLVTANVKDQGRLNNVTVIDIASWNRKRSSAKI